ncbi:MAG: hypothetical protein CVT90_02410 [Candidatus Altiarchaeales archaeon HGW-Altiarchaeales-3]|nr:MAG: hypothetical protein CVT90_02410 [Candidatus Altiarchaeales archaeon HGW-Altiarchaeales-3]
MNNGQRKQGGRNCIIAYYTDEYQDFIVKSILGSGTNRVILMTDGEPDMALFNRFRLTPEVKPILTEDISLIVSSVANIISDAKNKNDDISVLILPSKPVISIGMYIAACMENVKVFTPISDFEIQCITLPLFPFVKLNGTERFVLAKIIENDSINTKNLFAKIEKEYYNMMYLSNSKNSVSTNEEGTAFRQLHRILNKLEKMKLIKKEKRSKNLILNSTTFGKLISK